MLGTFSPTSQPLDGSSLRVALIVSQFHADLTEALARGAEQALETHAVSKTHRTRIDVPGAFELPLAAQRLAATNTYDAVVCLGAVIRGETPHFDYICAEASRGLMQVQLQHDLPIGFGLLTLETHEQGVARTQPDTSNKGFEAAEAAIQMALLPRS